MRNSFRRKLAFVSEHPSGIVRVDTRTKKLIKCLQPGGIAIIDHTDLDWVVAEALVERGASTVLNTLLSISGRYPNLGPGIFLDAGILLVDDLDLDIMRLHDGQHVTVENGSVRVEGKEQVIAKGSVQTKQTVIEVMDEAQKGLSVQLEASAVNAMECMRGEWDLFLSGISMPSLTTQTSGKRALVVVRGYPYKEDLQALEPHTRKYKPVITGVDGGADVVLDAGLKLTLTMSDMDSISDKALTCGAEIVAYAYRDGCALDLAHVEELGAEHHVFAVTGTSEDITMLMADEAGVEIIVAPGMHTTLLEFLDKGRAGTSSIFLTRLKVGGRLTDAKGVSQPHRTRISGRWLLFLALAGTFALAIALMSILGGQTSLGLSDAVWDGVINFFRSLLGLAPNSPAV